MNNSLFLVRAADLHLSVADLEMLSVGMVFDMATEKSFDYDEDGYVRDAGQKDFDRF